MPLVAMWCKYDIIFTLGPGPTPSVGHVTGDMKRRESVSHNKQFLQPFARTSVYFNSYLVSYVRLWNALPSSIVDCNDIRTIKLSCK